MQITINIPDNLPQAVIDRQIKEFEKKLTNLTETTINKKSQKFQAIQQIIKRCESLPIIDPRTPDQILSYDQSRMGQKKELPLFERLRFRDESTNDDLALLFERDQ